MKKYTSISLIIILLFTLIIPSANQRVRAETDQSRQLLLNSAKYALGLYLLAKLGETLIQQKSTSVAEAEQQNQKNKNITPDTSLAGQVIVIDPGHGGFDPGAIGVDGLKEKDINLKVALDLYDILQTYTEARIYLTRDSDKFISLSERAAMARRKRADIFISIHHNGHKSLTKKGLETYAHYNSPRETWALAWYIHDSLATELNLVDRGLLAGNFQVLRELPDRRAILLELGYLTNPEDILIIGVAEFSITAARAIYEGIINYYN